ncbi:riboflavin biosynthesis protein RibF [Gracilibacillus dipsosauri]|uniref:riboflavin biosynthesis protein RibF n=1 Tax=Gracilibacillus dipsosauri TaxID=178340 RepID=UPI002409C094
MELISLTYPHKLKKESIPNTVAAIGFFDGIHIGHQKVIDQAKLLAKEQDVKSAVITFDPHPSVVLKKEKTDVQYLTPLTVKKSLMEQLDVDYLYIIRFDKTLSQLSPKEFLEHFIVGLNIDHLVAGYDFSFGFKGAGNMSNIQTFIDKPLAITKVEKISYHDQKVSSTRIRSLLKEGNLELTEKLLGRPYSVVGEVVRGEQRGRTIGFPTANFKITEPYFLPRVGVYAVEVIMENNVFYGMANLGYNPTFTDQIVDPKLEVNIFDLNQNLYGEILQVNWKSYIRDEVKFSSVEELVEQIRQDEKNVRHFFSLND